MVKKNLQSETSAYGQKKTVAPPAKITDFAKKEPSAVMDRRINELPVHPVDRTKQNKAGRRSLDELKTSQWKYFDLYDKAPIGYITLNRKNLITEINQTGANMLDSEKNFLQNRSFKTFIAPAFKKAFMLHHKQTIAAHTPQTCELQLIKKDGTSFPAQLKSIASYNNKGEFEQLRTTITAITNLNHEKHLLTLQRDLGSTLNSISNIEDTSKKILEASIQVGQIDSGAVYLVDGPTGNLKLICQQGLSPDFLKKAIHYDADSPQARLVMKKKAVYENYDNLFPDMALGRQREGLRAITIIPATDKGRVVAVLNLFSHTQEMITAKDRNALEIIASQLGNAITRIQAEESLRKTNEELEQRVKERTSQMEKSKQKFIAQYKAIPVPTYTWQKVGKDIVLINLNDAALKFNKGKITDFLGIKANKLFADSPEIVKDLSRCLSKKISIEQEINYIPKTIGERKNFSVKYAFVPPDIVLVHTEDITERTFAEEALKESEEKFRLITTTASDAIIMIDSEQKISYWNPAAERIFGYKTQEVIGKDFALFLGFSIKYQAYQQDWVGLGKAEKSPFIGKTFEMIALKKDLSESTLEVSISALEIKGKWHILAILRDITEKKLLQRHLIQSERLAATGKLAASIAHEINSPLQGIISLLGSIQETYQTDKKLSKKIDLIQGGFRRIRDTVNKLLDLNRPVKEQKQRVNVNRIIEDTVSLARSHLNKNKIKTNIDLSPEIPVIKAYPHLLEQVFLNLINNAIEALVSDTKAGTSSKNKDTIIGEVTISSSLKEDHMVIKVADTGPGISEEDIGYIFDPFYTKKKRMGIGVGLSICHGIIKGQKGNIEAANNLEGGAVFTITLPIR